MIWLLLACSGAPAAPEPEIMDCASVPAVTWDAWGAGFFRSYCTSCHSSQNDSHRSGAPPGVDFDTEAAVLSRQDDVRSLVLEHQTMPIGGGVYPDDLLLLNIYLSCHAGR